jgi:uncharacterized membrane protein/mono/diheme cytochrome c family protein
MVIASSLGITDFIGRLHPLLVHLPIGILLIAALFSFLASRDKNKFLNHAVTVSLFWGMLSAIASCITGFLLSMSEDYDASLLSKHQWLGISTAVVSITAWYFSEKHIKHLRWILFLLTVLIVITGHLGGSITHGSDYLTKAFSDKANNREIQRKPVADIQNAVVYPDIIKPVLEAKCYGCHGPNKQKGKLRLDEPGYILKGGEDGKVIIAGQPGESDLIQRLLLPKDDEDHMPPKEKPQLSKQDIDLMHWWISNGADFTKKVNEISQTETIKPVLVYLQTGQVMNENSLRDVPEKEVGKADDKIIARLRERGVAVLPVAANSNYLSVNFVAVDSVKQADLKLLQSLKKQLLWLKMGNKKLSPDLVSELAGFNAVTKIYLDKTGLTDEGLKIISSLPQLQYINIIGNPVTEKGIEQLKNLKGLTHLYIYQTAVSAAGFEILKKEFPTTSIEGGAYKVPILASDTTELKEAIKK